MPTGLTLIIGILIGAIISYWFLLQMGRGQRLAHYEQQIAQLKLTHQQQLIEAKKRSVNTSRAVLKGKMAEQFAPLFPEFHYLPSDAKFLGDPVDYVIFDGYTDFPHGDGCAEDINLNLIDIKRGQARISKGQQAIAQAIAAGRVRFETVHIDFNE